MSVEDINRFIIPYQELLGNYNKALCSVYDGKDYTIPRTVRELQQLSIQSLGDYIIPYQELLGTYNYAGLQMKTVIIIPYQELFRRGALFRFSARLRYTRCCHKGTRLFRGPSPALERSKNA